MTIANLGKLMTTAALTLRTTNSSIPLSGIKPLKKFQNDWGMNIFLCFNCKKKHTVQ